MENILIRQKYYNKGYEAALNDLIDSICNSNMVIAYACSDLSLEYCDGDHCDLCVNEFRNQLNEHRDKLLENNGR